MILSYKNSESVIRIGTMFFLWNTEIMLHQLNKKYNFLQKLQDTQSPTQRHFWLSFVRYSNPEGS